MSEKTPFVPRPYQALMWRHVLEHDRCALWAGMGLGKTVGVLSALQLAYDTGIETEPTLVLAPKRVARNVWPAEAQKWAHLSLEVSPIVGTEAERLSALKRDAPIYTINYDNLPWLVNTLKDRWPFGRVVADESTRLKSHRVKGGGLRARALARVAFGRTKRWINLTGTPSPNGLIDLWGQQWFVDAGKQLGLTFTAFRDRWFYPHPSGHGLKAHDFAADQIKEKLRESCLAIEAKDWFDLKAPIVTDVFVDLLPAARKAYRDMEKEMFVQLQNVEVEAFNAASKTIKCMQIANGAIYYDEAKSWKTIHAAKLDALESIIEEAAGAPVLVAYHFVADLARLRQRFPYGRVLDDKKSTEDAWNRGEIRLLFAHPESAGHGLNLQYGGNILVFFGHWWALEPYQQIIERIGPVRQHQAGLDRSVFVYHIYARATIDEQIAERRATKAAVQDILISAMKRNAGE